MHRRLAASIALATGAGLATASFAAGAPEPRKAIDLDRFMGRWNEVLHTPNDLQKNCYAAFQIWSSDGPGRFSIFQVCHRGSATGPEHRVRTGARVLDPPINARFEASFFGGLIHKDYWILDHADDYSWMIASTTDGKFIGVLTRKAELAREEVEIMSARVSALGLDANHLVAANAGKD